MIDSIAKAMMTRYNLDPTGNALRALCTGGLWFSEAPQDTTKPYAVFTWGGSNIDDQMGGQSNRYEVAQLSVMVFSDADDGGEEVFAITDAFMTLFDWCTLDYTGSSYTHMACKRLSVVNLGKHDSIWTVNINYEIMYSH